MPAFTFLLPTLYRIRDQLAKRLEEEGDNFGTDYERLHENLVKSKEEEENL